MTLTSLWFLFFFFNLQVLQQYWMAQRYDFDLVWWYLLLPLVVVLYTGHCYGWVHLMHLVSPLASLLVALVVVW